MISLHWLAGGIILLLLALGWVMVYGGLNSATTFDLYQWHKSFGFVALALTLPRLAARFVSSLAAGSGFPSLGGGALRHSPRVRSTS